MSRPVIGIPMGDPAGIGPEIVVKALQNRELYQLCRPLVIGYGDILKKIALGIKAEVKFNMIRDPKQAHDLAETIDVLCPEDGSPQDFKYGEIQAEAGRAAFACIKKTVELAQQGLISAMATPPINKEAIKAAGIDFIGHTEMLAALTKTEDPLTMFQVHDLRIFFLSRHLSLRAACEQVKKERILSCLVKCDEALRRLGLEKKVIAVAGLNPHNGEHGLFGTDETGEIEPAVQEAQKRGLPVVGPIPADSVFHHALEGRYGAVLSLYHDQGHIAAKTLDFEKTVSLTIGMPFIRTSVDHGTAFDLAGQGRASSVSMEEAIKLAAVYGTRYLPR